ncbi:MAG TPA: Arm DNA-binding domain-containing protein [Prolixibacteraceae bacterium]|nr:Arm DNA-binding domain-containing protein [Prolixibacteraceae bacterium]
MNKPTFGIHFVIKTNKKYNGLAPIYIRITVDSKRCEISAKRKISTDNWDLGKGMAKSNLAENKQLNSYLEQLRSKMVLYYQELVLSKQIPTAEAIKNKFFGLEVPDMTLCKLIEYHNTNSKETLRWGH